MNRNDFLVEVIWEYAEDNDCLLIARDGKTKMYAEDADMMYSLLEKYDFSKNVESVDFKVNHGTIDMEIRTKWTAEELDKMIPEF